MSTEGAGSAYQIILMGTVNADLKRFHKELMLQGRGRDFIEALKKVNDRLTKNPHEFGETLYRLPALKLLVHQGIVIPLVVTFGIHAELPIVFVHVVKLLSNPDTTAD